MLVYRSIGGQLSLDCRLCSQFGRKQREFACRVWRWVLSGWTFPEKQRGKAWKSIVCQNLRQVGFRKKGTIRFCFVLYLLMSNFLSLYIWLYDSIFSSSDYRIIYRLYIYSSILSYFPPFPLLEMTMSFPSSFQWLKSGGLDQRIEIWDPRITGGTTCKCTGLWWWGGVFLLFLVGLWSMEIFGKRWREVFFYFIWVLLDSDGK